MKTSTHALLAVISASAFLTTGCDRLANYPVGSTDTPPITVPTGQPTVSPSDAPTATPSAGPTVSPSDTPTTTPTVAPSESPSASPTASATASPTSSPSASATPTASPTASPSASASPTGPRTVFALTNNNLLLSFNSNAPANVLATTGLSGLATGETILGIDFRPATGALLGISNQNKMYTINTTTGVVTQVGTTAFTPVLSGTHVGFDFNPTVDRIRVHTDLRQDLRLHPETGAVAAVDTALAYAAGDVGAGAAASIAGTAYTNSVAGATSTVLFAIDSERDSLVRLNNPNDGQLTTVGPLNISTTSDIGFDIAADGAAYASLTTGTASTFYTLNLTNGGANLVGAIGTGNQVIVALAVQ